MSYIEKVLRDVIEHNAHEHVYHQAVQEVLQSLQPLLERHPEYEALGVLERICEPERTILFRVSWVDDAGKVQVNRGYRVQFNGALGPYKGGLRFHPLVNLATMKFLAFEQTFKNALTGLPLGGGKGGSDFDPKGKSDGEIMRFCQAYMSELFRHIGSDVDVPAGDMGVGHREIGYMFGMYRKLRGSFDNGVLTGKGLSYGGSLARKEATGFGLCYFVSCMLEANGLCWTNQRVLISGSGNVAIYAAQKVIELGGIVVAMSDSDGYVYDQTGIDINRIKQIKEGKRGRLSSYVQEGDFAIYVPGSVYDGEFDVDMALPCATQNEIDEIRAARLVERGCFLVAEGANMPSTNEAIEVFHQHHVLFGPAKAANAGGVATSALEMSQNSMRLSWTFAEVDEKLRGIMNQIHQSCVKAAVQYGFSANNLVAGANLAGFARVVEAMLAQGVI